MPITPISSMSARNNSDSNPSKRGCAPMPRTKLFVVLLASLGLLTGCSKTLVATVASEELCRDWRHQDVSKNDKITEQTASQIEASNKSRPAWGCKYGEPS